MQSGDQGVSGGWRRRLGVGTTADEMPSVKTAVRIPQFRMWAGEIRRFYSDSRQLGLHMPRTASHPVNPRLLQSTFSMRPALQTTSESPSHVAMVGVSGVHSAPRPQ